MDARQGCSTNVRRQSGGEIRDPRLLPRTPRGAKARWAASATVALFSGVVTLSSTSAACITSPEWAHKKHKEAGEEEEQKEEK